jgi:hypothetical protein
LRRIGQTGLNTFATKKYGEDWPETHDYYDVVEEYAEWLEDKQYRDWVGDDD